MKKDKPENKDGSFLYKCRNCGALYEGGGVTAHFKMQTSFFSVFHREVENSQQYPKMLEHHTCGKDQIGIGDLAGFRTWNSLEERYPKLSATKIMLNWEFSSINEGTRKQLKRQINTLVEQEISIVEKEIIKLLSPPRTLSLEKLREKTKKICSVFKQNHFLGKL